MMNKQKEKVQKLKENDPFSLLEVFGITGLLIIMHQELKSPHVFIARYTATLLSQSTHVS